MYAKKVLATVSLILGFREVPLEGQRTVATADPQSGVIAVELESLLQSTIATHGQFGRQDMRAFGHQWSQDAQLFWSVAQLGAQLRITFHTAVAGRYQIFLRYTRAPDFALIRASFDGAPAIAINGYAPTVSHSRALLGMLDLKPGIRELLVEVAMKDGKSSGYNVGLDRLELEPVASGKGGASTAAAIQAAGQITGGRGRGGAASGGRGGVGPQSAVGPMIAGAQLGFAVYTPNETNPLIGATERNVYRSAMTVSLAWKPVHDIPHRWQVTSQPPGPDASLTPPGLLADGPAKPMSFQIALDGFQSPAPGAIRQWDTARDFYIRLVPIVNGTAAGTASNVVIAHYVPAPNPNEKVAADAIASAAAIEKKLAEMKEVAKIYEVSIMHFKPFAFADPERWGCIEVVKPSPSHPNLDEGETVCPEAEYGQGNQAKNIWDVVAGWVKAYDVMATFFGSTKSWLSQQIAALAPCEAMGSQLTGPCEDFVRDVASAGMSAGLVAAGLPPSLPNVSQLQSAAEGKVVQAAVDFTCNEFELKGGQCTPETRQKLATVYQNGINQLQLRIANKAKEPGCEEPMEASYHGKKALPCFTTLGMDVKPAPGAVNDPATLTVRVRRVRPNPPFPLPACKVSADISLSNYYAGGEPYAVKIPAQSLQGNPFAAAYATIPPLSMSESRDMTLVFEKLMPFQLSGNRGQSWLYDWTQLYKGGKGFVYASTGTVIPVPGAKNSFGITETLSCSSAPKMAIEIPD